MKSHGLLVLFLFCGLESFTMHQLPTNKMIRSNTLLDIAQINEKSEEFERLERRKLAELWLLRIEHLKLLGIKPTLSHAPLLPGILKPKILTHILPQIPRNGTVTMHNNAASNNPT